MKKSEGGADGSFGSSPGERPAWDSGSPGRGCDCPGPPPEFHLPPPPRPFFLLGSDCSENSTSHLDACEAVPVIDAEYHYSSTVPSLAIILTVAAAVAVFILIGIFLVLLNRRKMRNLFHRKSSPQTRCDAASSNGVIYEDLSIVRPRMLTSHCPPGQTTLPSIEMIDVAPYAEHAAFEPALMRSTSPVQERFDSRELFNPVYEELSNGSEEAGESDSEGMPPEAASEDEFAEDELSFGGGRTEAVGRRDAESSDSDDKRRFLENSGRNASPPSEPPDIGKRSCGGSYFGGAAKKQKGSHGRKVRRNKARHPLPALPADCNDFHEGFLLKRILQIYPDVTGMGLQYTYGPPNAQPSGSPTGVYETLDGARPRWPLRPSIIPASAPQALPKKNQNRDSSYLGSDSGYGNDTSSSRARREYGPQGRGENGVLS